ncbi:hypothetical protein RRG08_015169 [Elysia crispata]|uniref:Uncharacterized protein n=1 Tax=Elysia crispata TaxID=231223 RepID=A0AAE1AZQ9_9GAST|nr:hypothetical protein RRG08_015169 [Elysia crispata]
MKGKMYVLLTAAVVAATLLPVTLTDSDVRPEEMMCRQNAATACGVCSAEEQANCQARVIRHCDCSFNCQGPDCDCTDNNVCAPLP